MLDNTAPKISVLMTVYNSEKFLAEAISSVLQQTFSDFELVILDDCSKDSSWSIIERFAQQDARIRPIKNEQNLGGCENLNKGLRLLRGEYMARHDNDDWSYPDRLQKQFDFLEEHPEVGIIGGSIEIIDVSGKKIGKRIYNLSDNDVRKKIFRYSPFAHPLVMMRKSILDQVGCYYDASFAPADDYELWFRIGKVAKFANISDVLLKYRVVPGSITLSSTRKMELATIRVRMKYRKDGFYQSSLLDVVYNALHSLSIYIFPAKAKIFMYNYFRNE